MIELGFGVPTGGTWATPEALVAVARRAESLGYHSVWTFQRLLYAERPRNQYYGAPGGTWPDAFRSTLDPIAALTFVAAHTRRVRLGVSVLIMPFYAPVVLAKQLATLDVLSAGRVTVGLGTGWSLDEFDAVGAATSERGARADEFVRCLKAVWGDDPVVFEGRFYRVPVSRIAPKPIQKPHPPVLIGGYSDGAFRRAVTLGDGYTGGNIPLTALAALVARLRDEAARAGRDPAALPIVCRGAYHVTAEPLGHDRRPLWGSVPQVREDIRQYAEAGVTGLFLDPNFQPGGPTLEGVLEQMEALAPER